MTVRPPSWLQAGSFTADDDRLLLQSLLGGSPNQALSSGVISSSDYEVTETGTPSMDLDVASGAAWIVGDQSSTEGIYNVVSDASATVTISTADATNPRIDLVVLQVRNSTYSGVDDDAVLAVVTGTPAASPAAPAAPDDSITLAQIAVAAGASSITTADITDERPLWSPGTSGLLTRGNPAARIHAVTGGVSTSVGTIFATVTDDYLLGGFTVSTHGLVVPIDGVYHFHSESWIKQGAAAGQVQVYLAKNGSIVAAGDLTPNLGANTTGGFGAGDDIECLAGDYIEVRGISANGNASLANVNNTGYNYLAAHLVSRT